MNVKLRLCVITCGMFLLPTLSFGRLVQGWAMIIKEKGNDIPVIHEFVATSVPGDGGIAEDGTVYFRIYQADKIMFYALGPITPYGLRYGEKKMFVYDFDKKEEKVAFDFTLSVGEKFTTINGMEWEVIEATDTLVMDEGIMIMSDDSRNEPLPLRLLKVQSTDGRFQDQWMEKYGSFSNHLMIMDMSNMEYAQTPWVDYVWRAGAMIARTFNSDPIFGIDEGRFIYSNYTPGDEQAQTKVKYENNELHLETTSKKTSSTRYYTLYYRVKDEIFSRYWGGLRYATPEGQVKTYTEAINHTLSGLPDPESGGYTVHIGNKEYSTTGLPQVVPQEQDIPTAIFDLQGRRMQAVPERGVFIKDGKVSYK